MIQQIDVRYINDNTIDFGTRLEILENIKAIHECFIIKCFECNSEHDFRFIQFSANTTTIYVFHYY